MSNSVKALLGLILGHKGTTTNPCLLPEGGSLVSEVVKGKLMCQAGRVA